VVFTSRYLLDADASSVILFSVGKDAIFGIWKVLRVLRVQIKLSDSGLPRLQYEPCADESATMEEGRIAELDGTAYTHVLLSMLPLVVGVAIHSMLYYRYKSWWSWFVSTLADSIYLFGFAAMCPQLYINYHLRSVAHLPLRALMYKAFLTFIDDVFALLVKMPLKHKLMTLRDDIVFLGFLYQV
jgi:hypothetical protein